MKIKIITILAATAAVVLAAGCHHHDRDYYRPGPSHHYNHNNHDNGWHNNQNRPGVPDRARITPPSSVPLIPTCTALSEAAAFCPEIPERRIP